MPDYGLQILDGSGNILRNGNDSGAVIIWSTVLALNTEGSVTIPVVANAGTLRIVALMMTPYVPHYVYFSGGVLYYSRKTISGTLQDAGPTLVLVYGSVKQVVNPVV